ncbi:MAG: HAD-IA family hydrolase [Bryobacterales bacterium]|nr:HAD-IA family hydrolase [Bryobacteraceae bacterium]MDW8353652.1 HAD-IA family hydrolase [Bryobacterales bacterium]
MSREVLVFDMDGVLVDVTASYVETIRATVRRFTGREVSHEAIQDLKNAGGWNNDWDLTHKLIREAGVEVDYATVVSAFQSLFLGSDGDGWILRERWIARPGLLEAFAARYRLAIFTGRPNREARLTLDRFAGAVRFDPLIGSDDVRQGKPAPEGLLRIAELTEASALWYVGDTVDDARAARAARVPFIGVAAPGNPRRAELESLLRAEGAIAVVEDINELPEWLPV